jgi:CHASE2 domain-containing sensor protein
VEKLVVLNFLGKSISTGFQVTIRLGEAQSRPSLERSATLPPDEPLAIALKTWQQSYQQLDFSNSRIKGKPGQHKNPIDARSHCESASQILVDRFHEWLQSPSFRVIRETWLASLQVNDQPQVMIQTDSSELQQLPWHLWDLIERHGRLEVTIAAMDYQLNGVNADDFATQKLNRDGLWPVFDHRKFVKILAILGDAAGIDVQTDRSLLSALPQAKVNFLVEPKRSDLSEALWSEPLNILFFAGHSVTQGESGRIFLNQTESLTLSELRYALKKAIDNGLQLAIFNSCDGLGLAKELSDLQIPQIIVMREPVPDRVAQTFLQFFLSSFSTGECLYGAVREARERLQGLEGEFLCASWLPLVIQQPTAIAPSWASLLGDIDPTTQKERFRFKNLITKPLLKWMPIATLIATASIVGIRHSGMLQAMELNGYDTMLQMRSQEPPDSRIFIIEVTEEDIEAQKNETRRGSLSDQALADIMRTLEPMQPVTIGLDIYRDYPVSQPFPKLAAQLKNTRNFVAACRTSNKVDNLTAIAPPPEVSPEQLGFSNFVVDSDFTVRRHLLSMAPEPNSSCAPDYSINTQLALRYLEAQNVHLDFDAAGNWVWGKRKFRGIESRTGGYQGVDAWGHQVLLNYRNYRSPGEIAPRMTLSQVRSGKLKPEDVKGKIVLIGTTAESFKDIVVTPFRHNGQPVRIPGVVMQAQMTSQLISYVLDDRPFIQTWPIWGDLLWIGTWTIAGTLVGTFRRRLYVAIGLGVLCIIVSICCGVAMICISLWIPWIPTMGAMMIGGTIGQIPLSIKKTKRLTS